MKDEQDEATDRFNRHAIFNRQASHARSSLVYFTSDLIGLIPHP